MQLAAESPEVQQIDEALAAWTQGDLALEERWFIHAADASLALTSESAQAEGELQSITYEVEGLVVITQTCDIVRSCIERPYVEVAPLVEGTAQTIQEVERGRRPSYAFVPAAKDRLLVADLDRVMTVEKSVVASWERTPGCTTDPERRHLARALARKRSRVAFPDDFVALVRKLQDRLQQKHDKDTEEGRALRSLREIRVRAAPSWDSNPAEITFWFIRDAAVEEFAGKGWETYLTAWKKLLMPAGRFRTIEGIVVTLDDLTGRDYVESDPLDLDHLSTRAG